MKIFAISLPRFSERHRHIKDQLTKRTHLPWSLIGLDAVEMRANSSDWPHASHLRDSEVGCAASHAAACGRIVEEGFDVGMIVEDDVVLPSDIDEITLAILPHLRKREVISLYNRTILPAKFSRIGAVEVGRRNLVYPMETRFMRTAAAYILDKAAASAIAEFNSPVRVVADNWAAYYQARVIDSIRLLHPIPVQLHSFPSTLGLDRGSLLERGIKRVLNGTPCFSHVRALRRRYIETQRENNVVLVDLPSDQLRNSERGDLDDHLCTPRVLAEGAISQNCLAEETLSACAQRAADRAKNEGCS